ncbi:sortase domain-containing protein [Nocardioides mangrovicus]|uniref:sortase domain-containing protein n=1 Tax=Nocardioides mangrovicus TaxID=2478913 RepID=UPI00131501D1|nr:sortase [Nocardioides mangrovicus]
MSAATVGPTPAPSPTPTSAPTSAPAAPRRQPRPQVRAGSTAEAWSLVSTWFALLAVVCLWLVVQLPFLSVLSHNRAQALLYPQLRTDLASATAPTGGVITPGTPVSLLTIPTIGLRQVVVEGTTGTVLRAGPGHLASTVLPGQSGISVVMGRASTYGAPFGSITKLHPGDEAVVQMSQGRVVYRVQDVRHAGDPVPAAVTGAQSRLTLVTAEGSGALAWLRPTTAVYVDAVATKGFQPGGGQPASVDAGQLPMGTDSSALPVLALCLALLLGAAYVVTVAWHRFSHALVWVVASPVVLTLAWFTTDTTARLLPNLM